ncbi:MAG: cytochrome c3 family protein, partial [Hyphomicrobiales bacterium]|nr:cytochrome c3 family protein [Hyphomicrobiales bacterium]
MGTAARLRALQQAFARPKQKWVCGLNAPDGECPLGPDAAGTCGATRAACVPGRQGGRLICGRNTEQGGPCADGPDNHGSCSTLMPACRPLPSTRVLQQAGARHLAMITAGLFALSVSFAGGTKLLMPGPLATSHGSVSECSSCHSKVDPGPVGWVHNIFTAADPRQDSKACLTCHKVGPTAVNPHGATLATLERTTKRLQATSTVPSHVVDHLREAIFPLRQTFPDGVFCQTCHKEHQGEKFDLLTMPDKRCQACHTAKVHSFADDHPEFGTYPFRRRTRIFFDHASHFFKHIPDQLAKQTLPASNLKSCSDCHVVASDNRHIDVRPFEQICSACHLSQIVDSERPEGPKGIALLTLPGIDIETIEEKGADIGEWPSESDAELTPFMEILIGRDAERRKMLNALKGVDLLDLTNESDETVAAVAALAWEIKELIHTYSTSRPMMVLERLNVSTSGKVDQAMIGRLVASMPRDVLMSAQRHWLPNLPSEFAGRSGQQNEVGRDTNASDGDALPADADETDETDDDTLSADADAAEASDDESQEPLDEPEREVDAESWAELGGWYRQDYSILYRPTGHKDSFLQAWLDVSGAMYSQTEEGPTTSAFTQLTASDAQGQCIKCHSIDSASDNTRKINWRPFKPSDRLDLFTGFSHSPHLSIAGEKGCL